MHGRYTVSKISLFRKLRLYIYVFLPSYNLYQLLQKHSIATTVKYRVWNDWCQKLLYCLCCHVQIEYVMVFGLWQQEDGIFNYSNCRGSTNTSNNEYDTNMNNETRIRIFIRVYTCWIFHQMPGVMWCVTCLDDGEEMRYPDWTINYYHHDNNSLYCNEWNKNSIEKQCLINKAGVISPMKSNSEYQPESFLLRPNCLTIINILKTVVAVCSINNEIIGLEKEFSDDKARDLYAYKPIFWSSLFIYIVLSQSTPSFYLNQWEFIFKTLRPRQDGRCCPGDILKAVSSNKMLAYWLKFH